MGKIENAKYIRTFLNKLERNYITCRFSQFQIISGMLMFLHYDLGLESCDILNPNEKYTWKKFYLKLDDDYCNIGFDDCFITIENYRYSLWDIGPLDHGKEMIIKYISSDKKSSLEFSGTDNVDNGNKMPINIFNDIIRAFCYAIGNSINCPVDVLYNILAEEEDSYAGIVN